MTLRAEPANATAVFRSKFDSLNIELMHELMLNGGRNGGLALLPKKMKTFV